MSQALLDRITELESQVYGIRLELIELRVQAAGAAPVAVLLGGLELRRRFGETYASLAAVGAGIAGAYATLLAATALYHFVPQALALLAAAAIAAAGTAVALAWSSELVAAIGLI